MMARITRRRCPTDGELRVTIDDASLDGGAIANHLDGCERCRERYAALAVTAAAVQMAMETLEPAAHGRDAVESLERLRTRRDSRHARAGVSHGGTGMLQVWSRGPLRAMTAVAAILAVMLVVTFSPVKTFADDLLNQFRVQKFAAITIPMDAIAPMQAMFAMSMTDAEKDAIAAELEALGTFESTFGFDYEMMPEPLTIDEAQAVYGSFAVPATLPEGFIDAPDAFVTKAGTVAYTMDVARANEIVREIGLPIFSLPDPALYPTVTFTLNTPAAVALVYTSGDGARVVTGQMASPSLSIPEGVDMNALREDILRFPGLPTDFVAELRSIDDWENTLIVPVPEGASSRDVTINGQPGLLIESDEGAIVLWEKSGILYGAGGEVSGAAALDVAKSMK